jgi:hypothetical protein
MTALINAFLNLLALAVFGAFIILWVLLRSRGRLAQRSKRWTPPEKAILFVELFRR